MTLIAAISSTGGAPNGVWLMAYGNFENLRIS